MSGDPVRGTVRRPAASTHPLLLLIGCMLAFLVGWASPAAATSPRHEVLGRIVLSALGAGYIITSEGPLDASTFAATSPDPSEAAGALATLGRQIASYQRSWKDATGANQVQDVLVRFSTLASAEAFQRAAQHALAGGEIVSSGPLPSIPSARRTTYFGSTSDAGVGQAITMRAGAYVDLLSFFSAAAANRQPITPKAAERVAETQYATMTAAPGNRATVAGAKPETSLSELTWAVLAVVVLAAAVATPLLSRRRSRAGQTVSSGAPEAT